MRTLMGATRVAQYRLFDVVHPHDPGGAAVQVVVHWITLQCPKPWDHEPGRSLARPLPAECSRPVYDHWWRLYDSMAWQPRIVDVFGRTYGQVANSTIEATAPATLKFNFSIGKKRR